jgi:maltose alpha-D-glucosyltransferase/alpha-amylase
LRRAIHADLPSWLASRRWFADKGRTITRTELEDAAIIRVDEDWLALAVVKIRFADQEAARYFIPFALTADVAATDAVAAVVVGGERRAMVDANAAPWFGDWLIEQFGLPTGAGSERWTFAAPAIAAAPLAAAHGIPATISSAEQSNTSLRFGDVVIAKLFRRLQPGPNPDEEILRALGSVGFVHVPQFLGAASWRAEDAVAYPIALLQAFAPNLGDGWSWMGEQLARVAAGDIEAAEDGLAAERLLGRRTGEMHIALSQVRDADFAPIAAEEADIEVDAIRVREGIERAATLLGERQEYLPESLRASLPRIIEALRRSVPLAEGFRGEAGTWRIRVHGDFHLGQTLRTPEGDWAIIDFEGEPARPVAERRRKTSALKDVAGMLRSFSYARGEAERAASARDVSGAPRRLEDWEAGARRAFLEGYRDALAGSALPLAPGDGAAFTRALAAWELDKTLYEIAYEARNRPDWLALPLGRLVAATSAQPADATGAASA